MRAILTAALLTACAGAAHAQVLLSADNGSAQVYTSTNQFTYALDGTNTSLTFKTKKANEAVQFSFSAGYCGIYQIGQQSSTQLNNSVVEGYFQLDGNYIGNPTGSNNLMCLYSVMPQAAGMYQSNTGQLQQRVIVPTPGTHTIMVTIVVGATNDGTQIYPAFGQTHLEVRK